MLISHTMKEPLCILPGGAFQKSFNIEEILIDTIIYLLVKYEIWYI